jgi:methylmalonyl-CoA/ethylmalonyl-CoA epimerase
VIKGVYGINIAVKDLDEAVRRYEAVLGIKPRTGSSKFFSFPNLVGASFNINGFRLNLIASQTDDTAVAKFVKARGEGVFLVSLEVDDIENDVARMRPGGAEFVLPTNRSGLSGVVNFAHPRSMHGVQVEVLQPSEEMKNAGSS